MGKGSCRQDAAVDDYFDVTLHYGRCRVALRSSTLVAAPRPRFGVHGTGGSFVKYGLDPQEAQLRAGMGTGDPEFGIDRNDGTLTLPDGTIEVVPSRRGNYLAFYEAVADAILDGAAVPVAAEDARDGLLLISLARLASKTARAVAVPGASSREEPARAD